MPEPLKADRRYMPGLDGLRAVAVLGVLAYHLGLSVIPGGFLGVSVFFTLSGYLISDLILTRSAAGEFTLKSFWLARARRLLPAMFLFMVGYMRFGSGERWGPSLAVGAGLFATTYLLFHKLLHLPWPPALLGVLSPELRNLTHLF